MMHAFQQSIAHIPLPEKITYPFYYTPHPLCVLAAEEVKAYLSAQAEWAEELSHGKMFGVLLVQDAQGRVGYLAAFSGNLAGRNHHSFFVPPVYDLLQPDGFFKAGEAEISHINSGIIAYIFENIPKIAKHLLINLVLYSENSSLVITTWLFWIFIVDNSQKPTRQSQYLKKSNSTYLAR